MVAVKPGDIDMSMQLGKSDFTGAWLIGGRRGLRNSNGWRDES